MPMGRGKVLTQEHHREWAGSSFCDMNVSVATLMRFFFSGVFLAAFAWTQPLAIQHVTVIDSTGRPAQPEMTVVIERDRIAAVTSSKQAKVPANAQIIDGTGKFLIPGLWDMYVHVPRMPGQPGVIAFISPTAWSACGRCGGRRTPTPGARSMGAIRNHRQLFMSEVRSLTARSLFGQARSPSRMRRKHGGPWAGTRITAR